MGRAARQACLVVASIDPQGQSQAGLLIAGALAASVAVVAFVVVDPITIARCPHIAMRRMWVSRSVSPCRDSTVDCPRAGERPDGRIGLRACRAPGHARRRGVVHGHARQPASVHRPHIVGRTPRRRDDVRRTGLSDGPSCTGRRARRSRVGHVGGRTDRRGDASGRRGRFDRRSRSPPGRSGHRCRRAARWMRGVVTVFECAPLGDALRDLSREFDLQIVVPDSFARTSPITASFADEPIEAILGDIHSTAIVGARYTRSGRTIVIRRRMKGGASSAVHTPSSPLREHRSLRHS